MHIGISVANLEAAMTEFGGILGLDWRPIQSGTVRLADQDGSIREVPYRVTMSLQAHPAIELMEAAPGAPLGLDHLGYWVSDVPEEGRRLSDQGVACVKVIEAGPDRPPAVGMFRSRDGVLLEALNVNQARPWIDDLFPNRPT